jgi:hypothetical protein
MVNLRMSWITGLSLDISRRLEGRSFVFKIEDMILNCSSPEALRNLPPVLLHFFIQIDDGIVYFC